MRKVQGVGLLLDSPSAQITRSITFVPKIKDWELKVGKDSCFLKHMPFFWGCMQHMCMSACVHVCACMWGLEINVEPATHWLEPGEVLGSTCLLGL